MNKFLRPSILAVGVIAVVLMASVLIFDKKQALADPAFGDIIITVENELGASVSGATFTFNCDGTNHAVIDGGAGDDDSAANGTIHILAATVSGGTSGCVNFDAFTNDTVLKDGFVIEDTSLEDYFALPTESWNTATTSLDFAMNVTGIFNELGYPLNSATVTAGDDFATPCTESDGEWYCAVPLGDRDRDVLITKDGYVQYNSAMEGNLGITDRGAHTDPPMVFSIIDVKFAAKIISITDESTELMSAVSVKGGDNFEVSCTESNGSWFCPIPLDDEEFNVLIAKDGYVSHITDDEGFSDRVNHDDPQVVAQLSGIKFAYVVTGIADTLDNNFLDAAVRTGDNYGITCTTDNNGTYFCPVPLSHTELGVSIEKDGYVTNFDLFFDEDRDQASDAQGLQNATSSGVYIEYAVKVLVNKQSDNSFIHGATVEAGANFDITCVEDGNTTSYYCAIPLADTGTFVRASKTGYNTGDVSYVDRTLATDAQRNIGINLLTAGSGGGGGGSSVIQSNCSSVTYGEWQGSCVNGIQYRNIFSETGCAITAAQRSAAQRSCTNEGAPETPQDPVSGSSLVEQVTAFEKILTETINTVLTNSLLGRILLQVESDGESWYLNPIDSSRYFMGRPLDAFNLMRRFALGVNNADMQEFLESTAPRRLSGRIVMNVDDRGKAYYVNPLNLKLYYLGNPDNAFSIMKSFGLGISNLNLRQIKVGEL